MVGIIIKLFYGETEAGQTFLDRNFSGESIILTSRQPALKGTLAQLGATFIGFLWLSFLQPGPFCSFPYLKKEHILWHSGALLIKGVLSNPRKHLHPWGDSLCPGVLKTKKRGSLCAPKFLIQFWTKAAVRGGEGGLFLHCTTSQSCHGKIREMQVDSSFFLPAPAFSGHMASELASSAPKPRSAGKGWACSESHALLPVRTSPAQEAEATIGCAARPLHLQQPSSA